MATEGHWEESKKVKKGYFVDKLQPQCTAALTPTRLLVKF
jgi:hypothetical protein